MEFLYFFVKYLLIFFIGSLFGYVMEFFYRRFVSQKRWMNPGFLTGPYLPLYGSGLLALYVICEIPMNLSTPQEMVVKAFIILITMTLIEYITGLIFIVGMKIKLWDYSKEWGNIQGVICPLYSFFWGVLGFIYYVFVHPSICNAVDVWSRNQILSFFVGSIFGIFVLDMFKSFHVAAKISKFAKEKGIVVHYESMKKAINELPGKLKERVHNSQEIYKLKLKDFKTEIGNKDSRYALIGFYTSFIGFLGFPLILSIHGLKSKKYKKLSIAGIIISTIEIVALFVISFIIKK